MKDGDITTSGVHALNPLRVRLSSGPARVQYSIIPLTGIVVGDRVLIGMFKGQIWLLGRGTKL